MLFSAHIISSSCFEKHILLTHISPSVILFISFLLSLLIVCPGVSISNSYCLQQSVLRSFLYHSSFPTSSVDCTSSSFCPVISLSIFHSPLFIVQLFHIYVMLRPSVRLLPRILILYDRAHNLVSSIRYCLSQHHPIPARFSILHLPPAKVHSIPLLLLLLASSATRSIMPLAIRVQFFIHHRHSSPFPFHPSFLPSVIVRQCIIFNDSVKTRV